MSNRIDGNLEWFIRRRGGQSLVLQEDTRESQSTKPISDGKINLRNVLRVVIKKVPSTSDIKFSLVGFIWRV